MVFGDRSLSLSLCPSGVEPRLSTLVGVVERTKQRFVVVLVVVSLIGVIDSPGSIFASLGFCLFDSNPEQRGMIYV